MFVCFTKWSSVINSIYSGQKLFSYQMHWQSLMPPKMPAKMPTKMPRKARVFVFSLHVQLNNKQNQSYLCCGAQASHGSTTMIYRHFADIFAVFFASILKAFLQVFSRHYSGILHIMYSYSIEKVYRKKWLIVSYPSLLHYSINYSHWNLTILSKVVAFFPGTCTVKLIRM